MKTVILTLGMALGFSVFVPAFAADKTDGNSGTVAVQKIICNQAYVPAEGINGANYQPGVDVNGQAVVGADLKKILSPLPALPDYIEVPMTIDLAKKLGQAPVGAEMKMPVANLKLYKNGRVEYNGQDITSNAATFCGHPVKEMPMKEMDVHDMPSPKSENTQIGSSSVASMTAPPSEIQDHHMEFVPRPMPEPSEPIPGAVASSSTTPPPVFRIKLPMATVNRSSGD
jgi:hypothetical protein